MMPLRPDGKLTRRRLSRGDPETTKRRLALSREPAPGAPEARLELLVNLLGLAALQQGNLGLGCAALQLGNDTDRLEARIGLHRFGDGVGQRLLPLRHGVRLALGVLDVVGIGELVGALDLARRVIDDHLVDVGTLAHENRELVAGVLSDLVLRRDRLAALLGILDPLRERHLRFRHLFDELRHLLAVLVVGIGQCGRGGERRKANRHQSDNQALHHLNVSPGFQRLCPESRSKRSPVTAGFSNSYSAAPGRVRRPPALSRFIAGARSRLRTSKPTSTGIASSTSGSWTMLPAMIAIASGCSIWSPEPLTAAPSGSSARIIASVLITIGRNRLSAASKIAWCGGMLSSSIWYSEKRKIDISVEIPMIITMPIIAVMLSSMPVIHRPMKTAPVEISEETMMMIGIENLS